MNASTTTRLVLASTSPYRRALMEQLGRPFLCAPPACDEEALKDPSLPPRSLARMLARAKAESLRRDFPDAVIVGSDQVIALDDRIFSKPGSHDRALEQLRTLAGQTHDVLTAVALVHPGGLIEHTAVARMTMHPLGRAELAAYVEADEPLNCAGSYKLESRGEALFSKIDCDDRTLIVGLPVNWLRKTLHTLMAK